MLNTNQFGEWSKVYIQNIKGCRAFLDYIYESGVLGVTRKYKKYLELVEKVDIPSPKTCKYKGVSYKKDRNTYRAYIGLCSKIIHIGTFETNIEAALARDKYIIDNNLDQTLYPLNFP